MDTDTTTVATDAECVAVEMQARTRKVLHWPELVRVFNRLRAAEKEVERLRKELADA